MTTYWIDYVARVLKMNWNWMAWNSFLALIPLVLSLWLFRSGRSPQRHPLHPLSLLWYLGFLVFVAFLPNAPYVLTDIIHLIHDIKQGFSIWIITLVLIPQYLIFMLIGFESYVLSLMNLGRWMRRQGWGRYVYSTELIMHALSAVGIYLGRFLRFNSWDLVTQLDSVADSVVDDLLAKRPVMVMLITFAVITALYWLLKQVSSLDVWSRRQSADSL